MTTDLQMFRPEPPALVDLRADAGAAGAFAGVLAISGGTLSDAGVVIPTAVPATTTMALYNNSGTLTWNGIALAPGASLSGTTGAVAKAGGDESGTGEAARAPRLERGDLRPLVVRPASHEARFSFEP